MMTNINAKLLDTLLWSEIYCIANKDNKIGKIVFDLIKKISKNQII